MPCRKTWRCDARAQRVSWDLHGRKFEHVREHAISGRRRKPTGAAAVGARSALLRRRPGASCRPWGLGPLLFWASPRAGLRRRELWRGSGRPPARPTQRDTLMASAAEARALELIAQGDKKLSSYFASFFGNKYEAAEELYTKAANQHRHFRR